MKMGVRPKPDALNGSHADRLASNVIDEAGVDAGLQVDGVEVDGAGQGIIDLVHRRGVIDGGVGFAGVIGSGVTTVPGVVAITIIGVIAVIACIVTGIIGDVILGFAGNRLVLGRLGEFIAAGLDGGHFIVRNGDAIDHCLLGADRTG